jgi:hypothetical protein
VQRWRQRQNLAFFAHLSLHFANQPFQFHSKGLVKFETPLEISLRLDLVSQKQAGPAAVGVSLAFCGIELNGAIIVW